jgi:hypothetical protein
VLLAGWSIHRGKFGSVAYGFLGLRIVLPVLGVIFPRALVLPNRIWMALAEGLSFIMTRVVLGIIFLFVVTPIGMVKRLCGWVHCTGVPLLPNLIGNLTVRDSEIHATTRRCFKEVACMSKAQVVHEFWQFMKVNKKFWLAPIVIMLILLGGLLVLAKSSALGPFVYSLF